MKIHQKSSYFSNLIEPCADKKIVIVLEINNIFIQILFRMRTYAIFEICIKLGEKQQILIFMYDYLFCEQRKQPNSEAEEWRQLLLTSKSKEYGHLIRNFQFFLTFYINNMLLDMSWHNLLQNLFITGFTTLMNIYWWLLNKDHSIMGKGERYDWDCNPSISKLSILYKV